MIVLMNGQRVTVEVSEEQQKRRLSNKKKIECTFYMLPGPKGDCGVFQVSLTGHGCHMEFNCLYLAGGYNKRENINIITCLLFLQDPDLNKPKESNQAPENTDIAGDTRRK